MFDDLFSAARVGALDLANRIAMAPMTRSRAIGGVANDLMAEYYGARASAGLIITEAVAPDPNGSGYARMPGLFSDEQAASWRPVTRAVHGGGGVIVVQLMHAGRIGHPDNLPEGAWLEGPGASAAAGEMFTDTLGLQPIPAPREMSAADIDRAIGNFVSAARRAVEAGFDGVELHGANGYLFDQFLNPVVNTRRDAYGGDVAARSRFLLETAAAVAHVVGADRVGLRISPFGKLGDLPAYEEAAATYQYLADVLSGMGLGYLHIVDHGALPPEVTADLRRRFAGGVILNGGYDGERAQAALRSGLADMIAFGRPFLANPDLPSRLREGLPLQAPDLTRLYTPGALGYTQLQVPEPAS